MRAYVVLDFAGLGDLALERFRELCRMLHPQSPELCLMLRSAARSEVQLRQAGGLKNPDFSVKAQIPVNREASGLLSCLYLGFLNFACGGQTQVREASRARSELRELARLITRAVNRAGGS